jgi:hypothetical protein
VRQRAVRNAAQAGGQRAAEERRSRGRREGRGGGGGRAGAQPSIGHVRREGGRFWEENGSGEGPTDNGLGEGPTDNGLGEGPTDNGSGEGPTDNGLGEGPTDNGLDEGREENGSGGSATAAHLDALESLEDGAIGRLEARCHRLLGRHAKLREVGHQKGARRIARGRGCKRAVVGSV